MATARIGGVSIAYEVMGEGRPWVVTGGPWGRLSSGIRELAVALVERGNRVVIWDPPNTGESDVCFQGTSDSAMQAEALAGLLEHLDMVPAVLAGGAGGARVSLFTAARHQEVAAGMALWWISGGPYQLTNVAHIYLGGSIAAAWNGGMEAVVALPEWAGVLERNPSNRQRFLDQDPVEFIATIERWMVSYCPGGEEHSAGVRDEEVRGVRAPTLVFRSGASDVNHTRATSERLAQLVPSSRLVDPPWGDDEWIERLRAYLAAPGQSLFVRWPLLAPMLHEWADDVLG